MVGLRFYIDLWLDWQLSLSVSFDFNKSKNRKKNPYTFIVKVPRSRVQKRTNKKWRMSLVCGSRGSSVSPSKREDQIFK